MYSPNRGRQGQAALEFAFVVGLFLLCLFGTMDAAFWSLETMGATSAAQVGVQTAISATGNSSNTNPDLTGGVNAVKTQIKSSLLGTPITTTTGGASCPDAQGAAIFIGHRPGVLVCAIYTGNFVTVRISGYTASLVPPSFGLGWQGGLITIDVSATSHAQVFAA